MVGWRQLVGLAVAAVLLVGAGFGLARLREATQPAPIEIMPPEATQASSPATAPTTEIVPTDGPLHIYVSGAVLRPAVYTLPPGSLLDDAVRAAGGFAAGADTAAVNLAQPAADGMQVHVPLLAEALPTPPPVSLPLGAEPTAAGRMSGISISGLVNINTATQTDLEMLPGIGPGTAINIIAHREANGPFATIEDIMDVPGIGDGKFEAIQDLITVGP